MFFKILTKHIFLFLELLLTHIFMMNTIWVILEGIKRFWLAGMTLVQVFLQAILKLILMISNLIYTVEKYLTQEAK